MSRFYNFDLHEMTVLIKRMEKELVRRYPELKHDVLFHEYVSAIADYSEKDYRENHESYDKHPAFHWNGAEYRDNIVTDVNGYEDL